MPDRENDDVEASDGETGTRAGTTARTGAGQDTQAGPIEDGDVTGGHPAAGAAAGHANADRAAARPGDRTRRLSWIAWELTSGRMVGLGRTAAQAIAAAGRTRPRDLVAIRRSAAQAIAGNTQLRPRPLVVLPMPADLAGDLWDRRDCLATAMQRLRGRRTTR